MFVSSDFLYFCHCERSIFVIAQRSNPIFLEAFMDCFAEFIIGHAFARPVGSQ